MQFEALPGIEGILRVKGTGGGPLITGAQSALDVIATAGHEYGNVKLIIDRADVADAFFDLKTGIAGQVLQKFVNYRLALAIVGDFSAVSSKSLRDFIRESNRGSAVFFAPDVETAVEMLKG